MSHITASLCEGIYPGVRLFFFPILQPVCLITGLKKTLSDVGIHSTVGVMVIYFFNFFLLFLCNCLEFSLCVQLSKHQEAIRNGGGSCSGVA